MKETYMIQDRKTGQFWHFDSEALGPRPAYPLLTKTKAENLASERWGPDWAKLVDVVEATASEYMSFLGAKGGKKMTPKKRRHLRDIAKLSRLRKEEKNETKPQGTDSGVLPVTQK